MQDPTLERPVWIILSRHSAQAPTPPARALESADRPRWIGGGDDPDGRWDAFTAPVGRSTYRAGARPSGLPWATCFPCCGTSPRSFRPRKTKAACPAGSRWIRSGFRPTASVQLIDFLDETAKDRKPDSPEPVSSRPQKDGTGAEDGTLTGLATEQELLSFLGEVARLALEGRRNQYPSHRLAHALGPRPHARAQSSDDQALRRLPAAWGRRIRAAVPELAGLTLERLAGVRTPFDSLESLLTELDAAASRPTEISIVRRAIHLGIQAFFLLPGLVVMFLLSDEFLQTRLFPWDLAAIVAIPACWVLWAFACAEVSVFPWLASPWCATTAAGPAGWLVAAEPSLCGSRQPCCWLVQPAYERQILRRIGCAMASGWRLYCCSVAIWFSHFAFETAVPRIAWRERYWSRYDRVHYIIRDLYIIV